MTYSEKYSNDFINRPLNLFLLNSMVCFIVMLGVSCSKENDRNNNKISLSEYESILKDMYFKDQSLRRIISVVKKKCKEDTTFNNYDISRLLFNSTINKQDSLRTLKFLELIENLGYPDSNVNSENIAFYTILVHSPKSLHKRIDSVLSKSNIPNREYEAIKWHLNGRKGLPIFINGMKYYSDEDVFNYFNVN